MPKLQEIKKRERAYIANQLGETRPMFGGVMQSRVAFWMDRHRAKTASGMPVTCWCMWGGSPGQRQTSHREVHRRWLSVKIRVLV
jgi:hypothetical protein